MQRLAPIKRVVTGHNGSGKAIISSEGPVPSQFPIPVIPGMWFQEVWSTQGLPVALGNEPDPTEGKPLSLAPEQGGSRIRVVDIPPDSIQNQAKEVDIEQAFKAVGHAGTPRDTQRHSLMHRTETLDYGILVQGELWLVMDEGETLIRPGDIVVQRGTNHAWSNRTEEMARIVFILMDGTYDPGISTL
jgi:hypothetical protein